jgi:hypothetical protein
MTFLVDTNIFLEILLNRAKKESCKGFLENNIGELSIYSFLPGLFCFAPKLKHFKFTSYFRN